MAKVRIQDTEIVLAEPVAKTVSWIGRRELIDQLLACWTLVTPDDLPLCPRIVGRPGMGKTTLAQAAAVEAGREVYIYQCTMDTRPEDLLVTPVLSEAGRLAYHGSSLVTAMLRGGVAILDEANRMSEKSWASLAPLLDNRRYVESIVAGVRIEAHEDFRCCVTMNDDASTYEVPDYIISRLQPKIEVDFPSLEDERRILEYNVAFAPADLLDLTVNFLQEGHRHRLNYTTRDGINIMRYALKLEEARLVPGREAGFHTAVARILGAGAEDFEARARGQFLYGNTLDFGQLFTTDSDIAGGARERDDDDEDDDGEDEDEPRPRRRG